MKYRLLLASATLILSCNAFISPSLSQTIPKCSEYEEVFGFQVPTYATQLQGGAILNIKVAYRYTPEAIAQNTYPNFIPIRKEIDQFLVNYPSQGDFWEVVNKKLVKFILDKYPQIASLNIQLGVSPNAKEPYGRFSSIYSTRPNNCPLRF